MVCPHCRWAAHGLVQDYKKFQIRMCERCKKFFVRDKPEIDQAK